VPDEQTSSSPQGLSQVPQWSGSEPVSTHNPPHSVCPDGQETAQLPETHTSPLAQEWSQVPQ
jgi:hypothetical protein